MKTLLIILSLVSFNLSSYSQSNTINLIASCCDEGRGCTGSAYCTACKNCTGCKHCAKNGGSCGVCSSGRSYTSTTRKNKTSNSYTSISHFKSVIGKHLIVTSATLNLRKGPSSKYKIIEKLLEGEKLKLLDVSGLWLKVMVENTQTMGYIYFKYVKREE